MLIGSTPFSGIAPWQPFPFTLIRNRVQPAMQVPSPQSTSPDGVPEFTCSAIPASTFGFSSTPAFNMVFAPVKPSSSGWNTSFIFPHISFWCSFNSFAAPRSMVVCISCPQACMQLFSDAKGTGASSFIARASISALSRKVLPGLSPSITATIPLSQISRGSYPNSFNLSITKAFVFGRAGPTSGHWWMERRMPTSSSCNFLASSKIVLINFPPVFIYNQSP